MLKKLFSYLKHFKDLDRWQALSKVESVDSSELKELYELGRKIYEIKIKESNFFYPIAFSTLTGSIPQIYGNLNIPILYSMMKKVNTTMASGTVIVEARKLNVADIDGYDIYEASNGQLFIYLYKPVDLMTSLDYGLFTVPRLQVAELSSNDKKFAETSELLVSQLPSLAEHTKLMLINRITELQKMSYLIGLGDKALERLKLPEHATRMTD